MKRDITYPGIACIGGGGGRLCWAARRAGQVPAAAAGLAAREFVPLYVYFIDDHIIRLAEAGHPDLAARFRLWRGLLLARGRAGRAGVKAPGRQ